MELSKQEIELFPRLPKNFYKCFLLYLGGSKLIFLTGNGIIQTGNGSIQTGNGIISPTSRPLMKKLLLQNVSHLIQGVQN